MPELVLCTDLDRTLLPNGLAPASQKAYELFSQLCERDDVVLVYASGRSKELIEEAINEYQLPIPDYAIADVGATLYQVTDPIDEARFNQKTSNAWQTDPSWHALIAKDWHGLNSDTLLTSLHLPEGLQAQALDRQKTYKLSFITFELDQLQAFCDELSRQLQTLGIQTNVIPSINEIEGEGLIDLLPQSADKYHALRFLHQKHAWPIESIVFSGDSGNDLSTLTSEYQGVLVGNATDEVKSTAVKMCERKGNIDSFYIAKAYDAVLNGNYVAGILDGIQHFRPHFSFLNSEVSSGE